MTSWGCPFGCSFCSVTAMFGRKYRFRSAESVVAEIEEKRPKHIFFYDDNFAADVKRLKMLLRLMIERGLVIPWQSQVRTDVARDPELLDLMRRLGLQGPGAGTGVGGPGHARRSPQVADRGRHRRRHRRAPRARHPRRTACSCSAPTPTTGQTVRDTVDFALRHDIDTVMLNVLTPAPGTEWLDEMEAAGRIVDKRWELYDGQHVMIAPLKMTPAELQGELLRAYKRFYSFRRFLHQLARRRWARRATTVVLVVRAPLGEAPGTIAAISRR